MNQNHLRDDPRNSLVGRSALFVRAFQPQIFLMENARELIKGNFGHHFSNLAKELETLGYEVHGSVQKHQRGQASLIASLASCGYDIASLRSNITCREHPEPTKQADFITR
jgi:hypothetical protein